ncbi:MAG: NFACT family protein [Lachnospiraceae bacterium]|nr:NFACT family protein [Lachnospiraceae bacterium]
MANIAAELSEKLTGARISKIAQPEADELLLTIKAQTGQYRLLLSAGASLPLIYLTNTNKPSPMVAPNFCMLLRKHIANGKILRIWQPGLERILHFEIEHYNEMGDLCRKDLILELMGKHSNLIFCDETGMIIDSIKHVGAMTSSVREVLPGRQYFIAVTQEKCDPLATSAEEFRSTVFTKPMPLAKAIYTSYTGISPLIAEELCFRAGLESAQSANSFDELSQLHLYRTFELLMEDVKEKRFSPAIIYEHTRDAASSIARRPETNDSAALSGARNHDAGNDKDTDSESSQMAGAIPVEFASLPLTMYEGNSNSAFPNAQTRDSSDNSDCSSAGSIFGAQTVSDSASIKQAAPRYIVHRFASPSEMLEQYYAMKNTVTRIRQKSSDLRRITTTALDRCRKKYALQVKQLADTDKRDKYRVYGELIHAYGYGVEPGAKSFEALNYYTNEMMTVPLDPTLTAQENAQKYFDKYNKLKRTYEHLSELVQETKAEIEHLESICAFMDMALSEEDLIQVKEELTDAGYIRRRYTGKKVKITSRPYHYVSADGYDMYVGKNNYQNDELTFRFASGGDWWFHAKGAPGSHVIVKANGTMPPDSTFEDAARLAAFYSRNREAGKVEIDYVEKKQVKKPNGAKPGFVVYYTNYSMTIDTDISRIRLVSD